MAPPLMATVEDVAGALERERYVADRSLAVTLFLALRLGKPLFVEGEAGVGKTEIAKALASALGRKLIRLQCYEGLDVATPCTTGTTRGRSSRSASPKAKGAPA